MLLIVGGGAIGTLFAAESSLRLLGASRTASKLKDVVLGVRRDAGLAKKTVRLIDRTENDRLSEVSVKVAKLQALEGQEFDAVFLALKQYDLSECSKQLNALRIRSRVCVPLSNGLGAKEAVEQGGYALFDEFIPAVTYCGAKKGTDDWTVEKTGKGDVVLQRPSARNADLAEVFQEAFPQVRFATDEEAFHKEVWRKLLANCIINPITAIFKCTNGEVPTKAPELMNGLIREFASVCPVPLFDNSSDVEAEMATFVKQVCERTGKNRSSMLVDVSCGRRTEIDALNGALVRTANELNLDLPLNRAIVNLIKTYEPIPSPASL